MRSAALLLFLLCACPASREQPGAPDPAAAAEAFARALQASDTQAAWALLSARTQARADELAQKARVSADAGPESGKAMLFSGALPAGVPSVRELSRDGGAATLSFSLDGGPAREVHAVREGQGWKLELDL